MNLDINPVTADRWDDVLKLFGPNGAYSNCWCTWWILTGKAFTEAEPNDRRELLQELVRDGEEPGLLAYRDGNPVGWCAVGPRRRYARMMSARSPVYGPVDEAGEGDENWVINCFYLPRAERGQGIATILLEAAVDYAFAQGAASIDGYPVTDTTHGASSLFVGTLAMFELAGFTEIRRVRDRPLMRRLRDGITPAPVASRRASPRSSKRSSSPPGG
jgi:GNAT superfamily N-acetyltransferase